MTRSASGRGSGSRRRHDRQAAVLEQLVQFDHLGMQADAVVQPQHLLGVDAQTRANLEIGVVGVGDQGVKAVVAAGQLDDDQDAVVFQARQRLRLIGQGHAGLVQERRDGRRQGREAGQASELSAVGEMGHEEGPFSAGQVSSLRGKRQAGSCYVGAVFHLVLGGGQDQPRRQGRAFRGGTDRQASTRASRVAATPSRPPGGEQGVGQRFGVSGAPRKSRAARKRTSSPPGPAPASLAVDGSERLIVVLATAGSRDTAIRRAGRAVRPRRAACPRRGPRPAGSAATGCWR